MDVKLTLFVILAFLGLFLLGKGITGFTVVSQSCCFPSEDCDSENMCEAIRPNYKTELETNLSSSIAGILIVISSFLLIHKHIHKKG